MVKQSDVFDFDYNDPYRPVFHFSPKYGWTNDPKRHGIPQRRVPPVYQHNPYGSTWGNMHWGHAVTKDFKNGRSSVAIFPDGIGTIFSGSSVIDVNNTAGFGENAMVAIYTRGNRPPDAVPCLQLDTGERSPNMREPRIGKP